MANIKFQNFQNGLLENTTSGEIDVCKTYDSASNKWYSAANMRGMVYRFLNAWFLSRSTGTSTEVESCLLYDCQAAKNVSWSNLLTTIKKLLWLNKSNSLTVSANTLALQVNCIINLVDCVSAAQIVNTFTCNAPVGSIIVIMKSGANSLTLNNGSLLKMPAARVLNTTNAIWQGVVIATGQIYETGFSLNV